ncbi:MAG: AAA family ATPase [Pseudomonadales bacterium]|nr:AAA family ATPase [Pseudomonadales bacterium]
MLKELKLVNWKSFKEATLYIDQLTLVIGTNSSGKSNVLDALLFLKRIAQGSPIFQAIHGDANIPPIRGGMEWVCRKPSDSFSLEAKVQGENENEEYRYLIVVSVNSTKAEVTKEELTLFKYKPRSGQPSETKLFYTQENRDYFPGIIAYFSVEGKGHGRRIDLMSSHSVLLQADSMHTRKQIAEGVKKVISTLKEIFVFDPIPSHMRDYTPLSDSLQPDGSNIAGVLEALPQPKKEETQKTLTDYIRSLPEKDIKRIWTEPVGKFNTDAMLYCEEGWLETESNIVDARGMSDGTLRYLAIVTAMLTREQGSLLVIEEVDNGLHPSRAYMLIQMLRTLGNVYGVDVLITTHNPALLDAAGVNMIPFIAIAHRDEKSGESRLTQLEDLEQLPKLMAKGTLGKLSASGSIENALHTDKE